MSLRAQVEYHRAVNLQTFTENITLSIQIFFRLFLWGSGWIRIKITIFFVEFSHMFGAIPKWHAIWRMLNTKGQFSTQLIFKYFLCLLCISKWCREKWYKQMWTTALKDALKCTHVNTHRKWPFFISWNCKCSSSNITENVFDTVTDKI